MLPKGKDRKKEREEKKEKKRKRNSNLMTENKILNLNTNLSLIVADSMTRDIKSSETGKRKKFVVNKYFSGATNENMSDYTKPEKMELLIEANDFISKFHAK